MYLMMHMLAAVIVGSLISTQPAINAILSKELGSALGAAGISTLIAFLCILAILPLTGAGEMNPETLRRVPWWVYLAGVIGAVFVASGVVIAPVTGALVFFVCIVAGQLIGSTISDHFGAFGLEVREISFARIAGIALVLVGAILVGRG